MTDRETLAVKVMGITPDRAAQLFLWNPLTDANATLECLGKFKNVSCVAPPTYPEGAGGWEIYVDGKYYATHRDFKIAACRAMIAAVEGRAE